MRGPIEIEMIIIIIIIIIIIRARAPERWEALLKLKGLLLLLFFRRKKWLFEGFCMDKYVLNFAGK